MASIAEISKRAGLSTATVSRALDPNQCNKVRPETRKLVQDVCNEIGFAPLFAARALASRRTYSIGLVQQETISSSINHFISALNRCFTKTDYSLLTLPIRANDMEQVQYLANQFILSARVDGFILQEGIATEKLENTIRKAKRPALIFNMPYTRQQKDSNLTQISIDNLPAIQKLKELLGKRAETAAMISFESQINIRPELYRAVFHPRDFIIPVTRHCHFHESLTTYEYILEHRRELLKYPAWLCINDRQALGACHALDKLGIRPGKDIAVTGYDNIEEKMEDPVLTTLAPPLMEMSRICVQNLLTMIKTGKERLPDTVLYPKLIVRKTT